MSGTGIEAAQISVALLLFAVLALGGMAIVAGRRSAAPAAPEPAPEVVELESGAGEVWAAAQRAVQAADAARERATEANDVRDEAEEHYQQARWDAWTGPKDESRTLVERAALEAYRRGDLSVDQLNRIWQHTRPDESEVERMDREIAEAKRRYEESLLEAVAERRNAHVAEVAAEVLAEEARIAEEEAAVARLEAEAAEGLSGLLQGPGDDPRP
ncbi:hypothetical protein Acy02nite_04550 [Actinoplanes cyaneus]|uniref:Uncharacterized protein n=1 Tax=Actinoplanes cyaneus TaxID=52696 RepID=A0A919IB91_9ACTN|nr:hypothetical protein [Actinoplanes cyaneus]MCW2136058.1 hypothetical protein [Actinoplanes cyaneus]GID62574.1 hypothetical protein Acy02nite_04550 [Actinoplanes cyaneus]